MKFSKREYEHYSEFSERAKFSSPDEEYIWASDQSKRCNKCGKILPLTDFGNNTAGGFPFDKEGHRLRRGDCIECNKNIHKGKREAIKNAKMGGMTDKAPVGTACELCGSTDNIVFDHDHVLNKFRGWLCDPCNRSIGVLTTRIGGDTEIDAINRVISYLKRED